MRLLLDECLPKQLKHEFIQQNISRLRLAVVVLRAVSNDISDLRPLVPAALAALPA